MVEEVHFVKMFQGGICGAGPMEEDPSMITLLGRRLGRLVAGSVADSVVGVVAGGVESADSLWVRFAIILGECRTVSVKLEADELILISRVHESSWHWS